VLCDVLALLLAFLVVCAAAVPGNTVNTNPAAISPNAAQPNFAFIFIPSSN
jgi:hypothetical protein